MLREPWEARSRPLRQRRSPRVQLSRKPQTVPASSCPQSSPASSSFPRERLVHSRVLWRRWGHGSPDPSLVRLHFGISPNSLFHPAGQAHHTSRSSLLRDHLNTAPSHGEEPYAFRISHHLIRCTCPGICFRSFRLGEGAIQFPSADHQRH